MAHVKGLGFIRVRVYRVLGLEGFGEPQPTIGTLSWSHDKHGVLI